MIKYFDKDSVISPYITNPIDQTQLAAHWIEYTDNGPDQAATHISVSLSMFLFMLYVDADCIEKYPSPPYLSKNNEAEMVNVSVKRELKGKIFSSGNGTSEDMDNTIINVMNLYHNSTHAGLPLITQRGWTNDECLSHLPFTNSEINQWMNARGMKSKQEWGTYILPDEVKQQWIDNNELLFLHLKNYLEHLLLHLIFRNQYVIVLERTTHCRFSKPWSHCPRGCDHSFRYCRLSHCRTTFRGTFRYSDRLNTICTDTCNPNITCIHEINRKYQECLMQLPIDEKPIRHCSVCGAENHVKGPKCPKFAQDQEGIQTSAIFGPNFADDDPNDGSYCPNASEELLYSSDDDDGEVFDNIDDTCTSDDDDVTMLTK
jgi:hypothetical protein